MTGAGLSRRSLTAAAAVALSGAMPGRVSAAPRRLGALLYDGAASWAFLERELAEALAELGWLEGRTIQSRWRYADGDAARLPALAQALVAEGADVLLARGTPSTRALQQATRTLPIVTGIGDPVGAGFARSLSAPGGNVTGLSYAAPETATKQLELLRELAPAARRLLLVLAADRAPYADEITEPARRAALRLGLQAQMVTATDAAQLRATFAAARSTGGAVTTAALVYGLGQRIPPSDVAAAAIDARIATVFEYRFYVDAGGLISYRFDWPDQARRPADQIDKVLRGQPPATIPFELPTRSELVIHAGTAARLGLTLPRALRVRADAVLD